MKPSVSRIFLSTLLLLTPAIGVQGADCNSCDNSCNDVCYDNCNSCDNSCGNICNDSCNDCNSCDNGCSSCYCPTVFIPRSQGSNTVLLFGHPYAHRYDVGQFYGGFYMDFEYQRSFSSCNLAQCMFGTSQLKFQGSQLAGRDTGRALIADNFGLSQTFDGTLYLKPVIQNYILHWSAYFGFDEWTPGLYLKLDLTFANQNRRLISDCSCDGTITSTGADFPAGYMSVETTPVAPVATLRQALEGQTFFGDMQDRWRWGRFNFCSSSKSAIASFDFNLGYDFLRCEDYFLGAFFRWSAPTGNRPDVTEVFSAIVGNGHHWEIGGGLSGAWKFWECDDEQSMSFMLDGYVVTLLKDCQQRTFDLATSGTRSCLSRYMLLKQIDADGAYAGSLINAVNFTTRNAEVKINVKGDMTLRFEYVNGNFDLGFGYNLYGHARESICGVSAPLCGYGVNSYGIKGCAGVASLNYTTTGGAGATITTGPTAAALNATESNATIYACGDVDNAVGLNVVGGGGTSGLVGTAYNSTAAIVVNTTTYAAALALPGFVEAFASEDAVTLGITGTGNTAALDICSGEAPRQLTNKGFIMMNYRWNDCDWAPFLGFGAEVEGGSRNCDLAQWGIFIRGGISY